MAGKMDAIPGQTNETWIEASASGTYRGQCTEYCGLQHTHMSFLVMAQPANDFRKWWDSQLGSPDLPIGRAQTGQADFQTHCANCHAVRGHGRHAGSLGTGSFAFDAAKHDRRRPASQQWPDAGALDL